MENNHIGLKQFAKNKGNLTFYYWLNDNLDRFPFVKIGKNYFADEKVLELLFKSYEIVVKKPNNQNYFSEV
jgi:hypothetical protein